MSVVIPVWNAGRFLRASIDSILGQSLEALEIVVVDDGSTDRTVEVLREYRDPRVRMVRHENRKGVVHALNVGLEQAQAEYIARMDGDDVSHPERLSIQTGILDREPDLALIGSWANIIDEGGRPVTVVRVPTDRKHIHDALPDGNVFVHSSVMFRKSAVLAVGGYQRVAPGLDAAQDYHLWLRLADRYALANLPAALIDYRIHPNQVSTRWLASQRKCADLARRLAVRRRVERGETVWTPQGLRLGERLRGRPGSLGGDYLFFSNLYRAAGDRRLAFKLALRAAFHSPMAREAWAIAARELVHGLLGLPGSQRLRGRQAR